MKKELIGLLVSLASATALAHDLGQTTYDIACKNCHAPNLAPAIKAPAAFDKKAWKTRFDHASLEAKTNPSQFKTPMDFLVYNVKMGKGLMHHGGLCNEASEPNKNCSDEALIKAIEYMSKK